MAAHLISKARANLILSAPFWATIALKLKPEPAPWVETIATDGKVLAYNPAWVLAQDFEELVGVLAHEAGHVALCHHLRRGHREPKLANIAMDYAVNPLLIGHFKLPAIALIRDDLTKLGSFEAIYAQLQREQPPPEPSGDKGEQQPGQDAGNGAQSAGASPEGDPGPGTQDKTGSGGSQPTIGDVGGCGEVMDQRTDDGKRLSEEERDRANAEMGVVIAQALSIAKAAGNLPGNIEQIIRAEMAPKLDWRSLTRRYVQAVKKDDYSWSRPNRRFIGQGLYLPSAYNPSVGEVVLHIDTSGSTIPELEEFGAEFNAICEEVKPPKLYVVYQDAAIQRIDVFGPEDYPVDFRPTGGGGTRFSPLFEWMNGSEVFLDENGIPIEPPENPACCISLTDLECSDFGLPPQCPVLWVTTGREQAPFGEVVRLR